MAVSGEETLTHLRFLPPLLAVAVFMQLLDATILNTALPVIAKDLNESALNMQSAVISYALTVAVLMPLSGYLCDRYGTRRVFSLSMLLFAVGSVLCASAPSLALLVVGRIVQGMGGAMLMPVPRLIVMKTYPRDRLVSVMNYVITPALIGPVLGPVVGGYLVDYASWHWIFLINVPMGVMGFLLALKILPDYRAKDADQQHLDLGGFLLFAGGALGLTLSVETVVHAESRLFSLVCVVLGSVCLYGYWLHAQKDKHPLYATNLLQVRTYRLGLSANLVSRMGINAVPFLLPLLYQLVFGYSASHSGWMMMPVAVAAMIAKSFINPLTKRFGFRLVLMSNTRLLGVVIMLLSLASVDNVFWFLLPLLFLMGICNSIHFSTANALTIADLRDWQAGSGNSLLSVNQQLAISIGIALGSVLLNSFHYSLFGGEKLYTAFQYTFIVVGLITFLSSFIFKHLHPRDGQNLIQRD